MDLPLAGTVFISVRDQDKKMILSTAQKLYNLGFKIMATAGTSQFLEQAGFPNQKVNKVREGRPHVVDHIKNGEIQLVINTTIGSKSVSESASIRQTALVITGSLTTTTVAGARATAEAIEALQQKKLSVRTIQEYHQDLIADTTNARNKITVAKVNTIRIRFPGTVNRPRIYSFKAVTYWKKDHDDFTTIALKKNAVFSGSSVIRRPPN